MAREPLQNKWRPEELDDVIGNEALVARLEKYFKKGNFPRCVMFCGPFGCGKTTLALICGKMLGAEGMDLVQYNISDMRGIDTARKIINDIGYSPFEGKCKVVVLNEAQKGTTEFWNAMLETLENPPPHAYYIICTSEPEKVPAAVKGNQRATILQVKPVTNNQMKKLLERVVKKEDIDISEKVLKAIVEASNGSPRAGLNLLDKVDGLDNKEASEIIEGGGEVEDAAVIDICRLMTKPWYKGKWKDMSKMFGFIQADVETCRHGIKGWLGKALVGGWGEDPGQMLPLFLEPFYASGKEGLIYSLYLSCQVGAKGKG